MVVGSGMIASKFVHYANREDVVVFASGVSNSKRGIVTEFERERNLLAKIIMENKEKKLVYFSTFNLYDSIERNSPYCIHKLDIEEFIVKNAPRYYIFRLGHVAGSLAKDYTVLSFLYNSINNGDFFELWKLSSRNIIDIDDVRMLCTYIIDRDLYLNEVTNICSSFNSPITDLVKILEELLGKKANCRVVETGASPTVDNSKIIMIAEELGISFNEAYVKNVISKYYS